MEDFRVFILAFNVGRAGRVVNGPGQDLNNFIRVLKKNNIKVSIASELSFKKNILNIKDESKCINQIKKSDIIHYWSGNNVKYFNYLNIAKKMDKKIIIGPNVLDTTNIKMGINLSEKFKNAIFISPSEYLSRKLETLLNIDFKTIFIGPNFEDWSKDKKDNFILWKGNCKHKVKDVEFGLAIKDRLPEYKFIFLGYPNPYNYNNHISLAKKAKVYIGTSISETKCNALLEQWACGTASITNPNMQEHGLHMKTGIVCNRDIDSYCEAIKFMMSNQEMTSKMGNCAYDFVRNKYSEYNTHHQYLKLLGDLR